MKLLLDANLSWRLVKSLSLIYENVEHVNSVGLKVPAKDFEIWNWAKKNGHTIVTNDEDFLQLVMNQGYPPKIILIRIGNQSSKHILDLLTTMKPEIELFYSSETHGLLEIY